jgi:hypothetical protein
MEGTDNRWPWVCYRRVSGYAIGGSTLGLQRIVLALPNILHEKEGGSRPSTNAAGCMCAAQDKLGPPWQLGSPWALGHTVWVLRLAEPCWILALFDLRPLLTNTTVGYVPKTGTCCQLAIGNYIDTNARTGCRYSTCSKCEVASGFCAAAA